MRFWVHYLILGFVIGSLLASEGTHLSNIFVFENSLASPNPKNPDTPFMIKRSDKLLQFNDELIDHD